MRYFFNCLAFFLLFVCMSALLCHSPGSALEIDQAIENCRSSTRQARLYGLQASRRNARSVLRQGEIIVQACVKNAMTAARPKAALFSAEKLGATAESQRRGRRKGCGGAPRRAAANDFRHHRDSRSAEARSGRRSPS